MTDTLFEDGKPPRKRDEPDPRALALYQAYPLHRARAAALTAIGKALKTVDFDVLMAGVKRWAESDEVAGYLMDGTPKFIKRCATWFRDECWDDEIPETPAQKRMAAEKLKEDADRDERRKRANRVYALDEATLNGLRAKLGGDYLAAPKNECWFHEGICKLLDEESAT